MDDTIILRLSITTTAESVLYSKWPSLSLLRFCSSGCIDMSAAHTVNSPTDWARVGFHLTAGLGAAPCSATSLLFSSMVSPPRAMTGRRLRTAKLVKFAR
eukprot:scaffold21580_cov65-Phaeocystis_antarctica.AAC.5